MGCIEYEERAFLSNFFTYFLFLHGNCPTELEFWHCFANSEYDERYLRDGFMDTGMDYDLLPSAIGAGTAIPTEQKIQKQMAFV